MARELTIIQEEIIEQLARNNITVTGSRTSIRRIWTYVVAFCIWTLEKLFDTHVEEVKRIIETQKPHRLQWYQDMALKFQYGQSLVQESESYANIGLDEEQIEAQKIIKVASVTELGGVLRIKVAKQGSNGELTELDETTELKAFEGYIEKVKDAGVKIICSSEPPDSLMLDLEIFYNPLVLTSEGARIDGNNDEPVKQAVDSYLANLPFNGEYANTRLVDALQKVEGVVLPVIKSAYAQYGSHSFLVVDERYIPDAGYLRIAPGKLTITYRPYV